jgi:hypothetical protein
VTRAVNFTRTGSAAAGPATIADNTRPLKNNAAVFMVFPELKLRIGWKRESLTRAGMASEM